MAAKDKAATSAPGFYASALNRAERMRLPKAREAEGIDEELALLRVRLHRLAEEHPDHFDLLAKGVNSLAKVVALKYKLSDKPAKDLAESLAAVVREVGGLLMPERINGQ